MDFSEKEKILVVDDQEGWRDLLCDLLSQDGYEVKSAYDYKGAAELIKAHNFDLAVLDMRLVDNSPFNIDGMRILKQIKEKNIKTKAVILTGYSDEEQKKKALDSYGADGYFDKVPDGMPLDIDWFSKMIARLL